MSFLDRIKGAGRAKPEADIPLPSESFDELSPAANPSEATIRMGQSTLSPGTRDGGADSSIISEATPSELAQDFNETRIAGADSDPESGLMTGLPLIGAWPVEKQQRTMLMLFGAGQIGRAHV